MSEPIYLPRNQAPDALFGDVGGLYLIKPSYKNDPYIGRIGLFERGVKTFTGSISHELGLRGFFVCRPDGEVFIPHYDVDVMGVFVNAQVAK